MPFSKPVKIPIIIDELRKIKFNSVLDIGCGYGLYGALIRNYFEIPEKRFAKWQWRIHIEGVEVEKRYNNPLWWCYDYIHLYDFRKFKTDKKFDIVLLIDIVEHFDKEEGKQILKKAEEIGKNIIITTPSKFIQNTGWEDYPSETHKSLWSPGDFDGYRIIEKDNQIIAIKEINV